MSKESMGAEIAKYIIGKNIVRAKAWDTNRDIQRLLANIFIRAEQFAHMKSVDLSRVGVAPNILMSPNGKSIRWTFIIKPEV